MAARAIQEARYKDEKGVYCNAQIGSRLLRKYAWPDDEGLEKLRERMTRLNMSARAFDRILRVARTIADLDYASAVNWDLTPEKAAELAGAPVQSRHIAEAIGYRSFDRASYGKIY